MSEKSLSGVDAIIEKNLRNHEHQWIMVNYFYWKCYYPDCKTWYYYWTCEQGTWEDVPPWEEKLNG